MSDHLTTKTGRKPRVPKPTIVCLCGSTRFGEAFRLAEFQETLAGKIVLTIGCNMKCDDDLFGHLNEAAREQIKRNLDELHLRKIDLAKEVLILNVGGYIGESTSKELAYAQGLGKTIRYLEIPSPTRERRKMKAKNKPYSDSGTSAGKKVTSVRSWSYFKSSRVNKEK